jgi:hypothetical protein
MPNWCTNMISIKGESEGHIKDICEALKSDTSIFDFNKIIPYPEKYAELDRIADEWRGTDGKPRFSSKDQAPVDGFNQGGHEWVYKNWGTKWNVDSKFIAVSRPDEDQVVFCFDTAWSPPTPVIQKLSELFPTAGIVLRFKEPDMEEKGLLSFKAGSVFEEEIDEEDEFFIDEYEEEEEQG